MTQASELPAAAWWRLPWWAVLVVAVFLGAALFGERGVLRVMSVSSQRAVLQQEITRLSEKNDHLAGEIRSLRSDRRYIEDIARRDLRMAKENEIIYVFPSPRNQAPGQTGAALSPSGSR